MPNNSTLSILNNYITNSVVYSPDGRFVLNMNNTAYIRDCIFSDVDLYGKIECRNTDFYGEIILNGEMYNEYSTSTVNIVGNITNNGSIHDYASYYLNLNVSGDIINNGIWSNQFTYLTGTGNHNLSQNGDAEFSGDEFIVEEGSGLITLLSNFDFISTEINLNGTTLELDNSKNGSISIRSDYIKNGNIIANNNEIRLSETAFIQDMIIENAVLRGIVEIKGDNNEFSGNTILTDTLQNDYSSYTLSIYDDFTNNGLIYSYATNFYINMYGNIVNNGEIINSSGGLYFDIYGNIVNNGVWNSNEIELKGESDQNISCLNENEFEVDDFIDQQSIGLINALTDLYFIECNFNLNNDTLLMPNNSTLSILNNYITNSIVYSPDGRFALNMNNSAFVQDCVISDVDLYGIIECRNTDFYGEIILNGEMYNEYSTHTVNIDGNITNNGSIHDYAYYLNLNVSGDIINNGIWSNQFTYLTGTGNHNLSQNGDAEFSGDEFIVEEGSGLITLLSNFDFISTEINLNGTTLELDNSKNGSISIRSDYIKNGNIIANNNEIRLSETAFIQDMIIENAVLRGIVEIKGDNNEFSGNTILTDTLQNDYSSYTLSIYDDFTNNGLIYSYATNFYIDMYGDIVNNAVIGNSSGALYFDIYGDIVNNGVWNSDDIELRGESDQNISCLNESIFDVDDFSDEQAEGLIIALSDLNFIECNFNLNNDTLLMPNNSTLSILNNYITNSIVYSPDGRFALNMNNSAFVQDCVISDVDLYGIIECKNTDFYGEIILNGEMYNEYSTYTVNIVGNITNNGSIHDYAYNLNLNVSGDIINNGEWDNYQTLLDGTDNQHVYLINANEITGQFRLLSDIQVSPFQWYLNGEPITNLLPFSGWNTNTLIFNNAVSEWLGVYYCSTGGGASRNIIIETESPIADFIADVTSGYNPLEVYFEDLSPQSYSEIIEWSWDFGDGKTSSLQNPTNLYENYGTYTVSLTVTDVNELTDTETKIDYINVSLSGGQIIELIAGYSFVSTRIIPENADFLVICDDILPNLDFVRNTAGDMLRKIGPMWINSIGNWITTEGYLFRMNDADELIILGDVINPQTPIPLIDGYQLISYLPENPIDALTAFTDVLDNLDFVRNSSGDMLRKIGPNWINGIGDMNSGEGYLVRMLDSDELIYPVSGEKFAGIADTETEYFKFEGGNAADQVYTIYVDGLQIGDEVAAFDGDKMIGSVKIISQNAFDNDLAVFNTVNSGQGYQAGNPIQLKVWDSFTQKTSVAELSMIDPYYEAYMQKVYPNEDGLYSVVKISKSLIGMENIDNEISIYPNPSNGIITIENLTGLSLEITDLRGRIFFQSKIINQTKQSKRHEVSPYGPVWESKMKIDLSDIESGIYLVRIIGKNFNKVEKIVIQ